MDIRELHKYQIEKQQNKISIYEKVLSRCFHKIKSFAKKSQTYCFCDVPNIILGLPYYNLKNCIHYVMQRLVDYNFKVIFINPNILFITWDIRITKSAPPKKISNQTRNLNIQMKNLTTSSNNTHYNKNNNFKEITNYKPTSKIIYDDKSIIDFNNKTNSLLFNKKKNNYFNL